MENLDAMRQFATLAGILAGFSFSALIHLVSMNDKRRIIGVTASAFALATCFLLSSLFSFGFLALRISSDIKSQPPTIGDTFDRMLPYVISSALVCFGGIVSLLLGIGLSGWIRSKRMGIITGVVAAIALLGMVAVLFLLKSLS